MEVRLRQGSAEAGVPGGRRAAGKPVPKAERQPGHEPGHQLPGPGARGHRAQAWAPEAELVHGLRATGQDLGLTAAAELLEDCCMVAVARMQAKMCGSFLASRLPATLSWSVKT